MSDLPGVDTRGLKMGLLAAVLVAAVVIIFVLMGIIADDTIPAQHFDVFECMGELSNVDHDLNLELCMSDCTWNEFAGQTEGGAGKSLSYQELMEIHDACYEECGP